MNTFVDVCGSYKGTVPHIRIDDKLGDIKVSLQYQHKAFTFCDQLRQCYDFKLIQVCETERAAKLSLQYWSRFTQSTRRSHGERKSSNNRENHKFKFVYLAKIVINGTNEGYGQDFLWYSRFEKKIWFKIFTTI